MIFCDLLNNEMRSAKLVREYLQSSWNGLSKSMISETITVLWIRSSFLEVRSKNRKLMIDPELLQRIIKLDDDLPLFAESTSVSGEFFLEVLDLHIAISDEGMDAVFEAQEALRKHRVGEKKLTGTELRNAKEIYLPFMQAHNHELIHLLQVLSLPAMRITWAARVNYLRYEAAIMLRFFELGGSYQIGVNRKLVEAANSELLINFEDDEDNGDEICSFYEFYRKAWNASLEGISLFFIIEGMAHIASLQLSDYSTDDMLGIANDKKYHTAFKHFECSLPIGIEISDHRKNLLFLYLCYFACQRYNPREDSDGLAPVKTFLALCAQSGSFLKTIDKLEERYARYSRNELIELRRWGISDEHLKFAKTEQIVSIYAFFEFVQILDELSLSFGIKSEFRTSMLDDFWNCSKKLGIDWKDHHNLARMMIFPQTFVGVREIYDDVMAINVGETEYTYADNADFFRFIVNCKRVLDERFDISCCEKHGVIDKRKILLNCNEEGGFGFYLEALTGRPANDLFCLQEER